MQQKRRIRLVIYILDFTINFLHANALLPPASLEIKPFHDNKVDQKFGVEDMVTATSFASFLRQRTAQSRT